MSEFRIAVDDFLSKNKTLAGIAEWVEASSDQEMVCFWLLTYDTGETTPHRLHIQAQPFTPWSGYCISVQYHYLGRYYPVVRLNVDTDQHMHPNHLDRPKGLPLLVSGNREYLWRDNRLKFSLDMPGLPYARALAPQNLTLPNAIRHICGVANIKPYDTILPDYPRRTTLV